MLKATQTPTIQPPDMYDKKILTLDLETDGLNWYREPDNRIVSGVFREHDGTYHSLLLHHPENEDTTPQEWVSVVQDLIDSHDVLLGANIKFDLLFLNSVGVRCFHKLVLDVSQIEYRLTGQTVSYPSLEQIAQKYLGYGKLDGLDFKSHKASTYPADLLLRYNVQDVEVTYASWEKQWPLVLQEGIERILYVDHASTISLADMESVGFRFDGELCETFREDVERRYKQAEAQLFSSFGVPDGLNINLGSSQQLKAVLFGGTIKTDGTELKTRQLKPKSSYRLDDWLGMVVTEDGTGLVAACPSCGEVISGRKETDGTCKCHTVGWVMEVSKNRIAKVHIRGPHLLQKTVLTKCVHEVPIEGLGFSWKDLPNTDKYMKLCREARSEGDQKPEYTVEYVATDKAAMSMLVATTDAQRKFLGAWELYNNLGTCLDNFLTKYPKVQVEGKLYTNYNLTRTATGRLSSSGDYNAQQIPSRDVAGVPKIKKLFLPNQGYDYILNLDYSGQEVVMLANMAEDAVLISELLAGLDMHRANAANLYGISEQEVTKAQRSATKACTFATTYGSTAKGLSMNRDTGLDLEGAQQFLDVFYSKYTGVAEWHDYLQEVSCNPDRRGRCMLRMPTGEYFLWDNPERQVTKQKNYPIQGSSATVTKVAIALIRSALLKGGYQSRLIGTVHDSVSLEVVAEELWDVTDLVRDAMTVHTHDFLRKFWGLELRAPLSVEADYGTTYAGGIPIYVGAKAKKGEFVEYRGLTYEAQCDILSLYSDLGDVSLWKTVDKKLEE